MSANNPKKTYEAARETARQAFERGEISAATLRRKFSAINAAEGRSLAAAAKKAYAALEAYRDRLEREKVRASLLSRLTRSLKRYETQP